MAAQPTNARTRKFAVAGPCRQSGHDSGAPWLQATLESRNPFPLAYAFSTLGCPDATWEKAVAMAKVHGFSAIELRALEGSVDLPALLRDTFGSPERMAGTVEETGVQVASLDASLRLLDDGPEQWKELLSLAPWADALGVPFLRVFDGGTYGSGKDPEIRRTLSHALARWQIIRRSEGFRCDLMVETHWALTDAHAGMLLGREMEAEGHRLNLLWDSSHTWTHGGADPGKGWELLKPWVRHIHIKDGVRDGETLRLTLPGEGDIPIDRLLPALARDNFTGPVSLEWERMWNPELPPLETALAAGRKNGWW